MAGKSRFSPEQVTEALTVLATYGGNPTRAASVLQERGMKITPSALKLWKAKSHAEQYRRIEEHHGRGLEMEAVAYSRRLLLIAAEAQTEMVEKVRKVTDPAHVANALRALTDIKKTETTALLQLTGRPTNPQGSQSTDNIVTLLQTMIEKNYLKPADGVSIEPVKVQNYEDRGLSEGGD